MNSEILLVKYNANVIEMRNSLYIFSGVAGSPFPTTLEARNEGRATEGPSFTSTGQIAGEWSSEATLPSTPKQPALGKAAAQYHS